MNEIISIEEIEKYWMLNRDAKHHPLLNNLNREIKQFSYNELIQFCYDFINNPDIEFTIYTN